MSAPTLVPPKTKSQALRSFDVADFPALNGREEEWRFTPLKRLRGLATLDGAGAVTEPPKHEYGDLPAGASVSTVERSDTRVGSALTPSTGSARSRSVRPSARCWYRWPRRPC